MNKIYSRLKQITGKKIIKISQNQLKKLNLY